MDAGTDSGSISVKDWDRNGLGKRKLRYTSARPLWAWKLRLDVRKFIFLPASISVTEGRLMGGGRHKAGDSEAEGGTGHDIDHLAMEHIPHRWSARSVLKDRTRLLQPHCYCPAVNPRHRAQPSCCHQKHRHFLPKSLSIPKPLLKTQQSKLWESPLGLGPVLIKSSFISLHFPL